MAIFILAAVIAAVELPVYDFCKLHLLETFGDHVANHFMYINFSRVIEKKKLRTLC